MRLKVNKEGLKHQELRFRVMHMSMAMHILKKTVELHD